MPFESKRKKIRFIGLSREEMIRYFFGGNASLAIFILALICLFLFREAFGFFPMYREEMKRVRMAGVEYFNSVEAEHQAFKLHAKTLKRAFEQDYQQPGQDLGNKIQAYATANTIAWLEMKRERGALKDLESQIESTSDEAKKKKLREVEGILKETILSGWQEAFNDLRRGDDDDFRKLTPEEFSDLKAAWIETGPFTKDDPSQLVALEDAQNDVLGKSWEAAKPINDLYLEYNKLIDPLDDFWRDVRKQAEATFESAASARTSPRRVTAQLKVALGDEAQANPESKGGKIAIALREAHAGEYFHPVFKRAAYPHLLAAASKIGEDVAGSRVDEETLTAIREAAPTNHADWSGDPTAAAAALVADSGGEPLSEEAMEALENIMAVSIGSDEALDLLADEVPDFLLEFPYDEAAEVMYGLTSVHREAIDEMQEGMAAVKEKVPTIGQTDEGTQELLTFHEQYDDLVLAMEDTQTLLEGWRHDEKVSIADSMGAFFFGLRWKANEQFRKSYGILPLFSGSFVISIIALALAVPVSISAAIYVNQIAGVKEQNLLKPALEFIGAIPSIVLGFLGIAVLGETLKNFSEAAWVQWLPGFPILERLNMLTAGLLLAFMAVPTIFSLAEDALNNVPDAYKQASLALGATKLQSTLKVILPAASSGIIAAVLLGFGRVIGETMVVLLVAGNRISIPDFSKGIGVVTEPSHTMTGIIAQSFGEAETYGISYRGLFMLGLVLFVIALVINFSAQVITKRLTRIR